MSKLDRIVVLHDFMEMRGGAAVLARLSAEKYDAFGIEVVYISGDTDDGSLSGDRMQTIGLGQDPLLSLGRFKAFTHGIYNREAANAISDWIKKHDTPGTAYHLHNWSQILSPSIFDALAPVSNRTVVSCHDMFNVCPNGGLLHFPTSEPCYLKPMSIQCWASQCDRRSAVQKYWRMIRQLNLQRVAKFSSSKMTFVCLHEGMVELFRTVGFPAPNLVSIANPATPYTEDRIECESNRPFLFIGRLTAEKGADIALAETKRANVPIIMIGSGDLEDSLKAEYDHAEFAGFCDRPEIEKYARKARAIIVPSRVREPFGLVVGEGALSGLPVLISQQGMLSGKIKELGMGDSFNPNQPGDLAGKVEAWAADDKMLASLSHKAFENAHKISSSPDSWAQQFIELMTRQVETAAAV